MEIETEYANTDFELKSSSPFDALAEELSLRCYRLHYTHGEDGNWHAIFESNASNCDAATDIQAMVDAIESLSPTARSELNSCYLREFNIGFHCGDSWSYVHTIPAAVVDAVAKVGCSMAVTLYPMRKSDGTPRE
jgi:hypothetical protein